MRQASALGETAYTDDGVMINSRFLDGMTPEAAFNEVASRLEKTDLVGRPQAVREVQFRPARLGHFTPALLGLPDPDDPLRKLRGVNPVPRADLPVKLPDDVEFDRPGNPLDRHARPGAM